MTSGTFLIGPLIKDGIRKDVKPHAIPEDAWESLLNVFQFRGRMVRRYGYTSLKGSLATTRLSPDGGITFLNLPVMGLKTQDLFGIGLQNLIGFDTQRAYSFSGTVWSELSSVMVTRWSGTNYNLFFTANYAGAFWATNSKPGIHGASISGIITGTPTTITTILPHGFTTNQWVSFINIVGTTELNGQNAQITVTGANTFTVPITTTNAYVSGGFALNNQVSISGQDGIRYYADTNVGNTWVNYNPPIDTNTALMGALLIFPYRGYLVFLNTWEGSSSINNNNFPNRARWTQIGTPYYSQPVPITPAPQTVDPLAVRDDIFGRGGATDAPTDEIIVGAEFVRDILIVYFQRSTWRLRFVNNSQNPFVWERVNKELGSQCTFSTISFDKGAMAISPRGIIISDGNDALRFDQKIPDDAFNIRIENQGLQRVYGIRAFQSRFCYWAVGDASNTLNTFPDQILAYNYDTQTWSTFDDSFTCFGYYSGTTTGYTWNDLTDNWSSYPMTWDAGHSQAGYETVIAGNQQGFVFALEQTDGQNSPSLLITNISSAIVTSNNHNLADQSWITLTNISGTTYSDGVSLNDRNFKIAIIDANTFTLQEFKSQQAGNVSGTLVSYFSGYTPVVPGTVQINIGSIQFVDRNADGVLVSSGPGTNSGTINYETGRIILTFSPGIASTAMYIRLSSFDLMHIISPIATTGVYSPGGLISKISNFSLVSKIFNFFQEDLRTRLSKIDFYTAFTQNGQFTCNVYGDSTDVIINQPLPDNPESNIVLTSQSANDPVNQIPGGQENIYRLYCDAIAQTVQIELTMSDQQMSSTAINTSNFELNSLMVTLKKGGRLV